MPAGQSSPPTTPHKAIASRKPGACRAVEPQMAGTFDPAPSFEAIANRQGTTALSLKVFLKTNHQNMPDLVIAPDQADALANYILSLRTN